MGTLFIGARQLEITDGKNPSNWNWPSGQDVAQLIGDNVLDIVGQIQTRRLTEPPYVVYFVYKFEENHKNIDQAYAAVGTDKDRLVSLTRNPYVRTDSWFEVELGEYQGGGSEQQLVMRLRGIDEYNVKYGLIVKGMEIRPKP